MKEVVNTLLLLKQANFIMYIPPIIRFDISVIIAYSYKCFKKKLKK